MPDDFDEVKLNVDGRWLKENRNLITEKMRRVLKRKHPETADWFPRFKIKEINGANISVEKYTSAILNDLNESFLPVKEDSEVWIVSLYLTSGEQNSPKIEQLLPLLPHFIAMCYSSVLIICPGGYTDIVLIEADVTKPDGETVQIRGTGAVDHWVANPEFQHHKDGPGMRSTKAYVAAITSLIDNTVRYIENTYPNRE